MLLYWLSACKAACWLYIKLDMLLDDGSLQAARLSDIKLDMMLDDGSLQAARLSEIKLDMT